MTSLGKALVFMNLALSLVMAVWAELYWPSTDWALVGVAVLKVEADKPQFPIVVGLTVPIGTAVLFGEIATTSAGSVAAGAVLAALTTAEFPPC